eukprot:TRINITY_DN4720_c0_g2_i1.p1 TRINITY_DN4720_c0_g2~~TRINITY_DN4720_c0_g2_i1.p1  ORF type:complete len:338 (+),score=40.62 TRINITY_DN4720_c0_g2_i1:545-1558(+)
MSSKIFSIFGKQSSTSLVHIVANWKEMSSPLPPLHAPSHLPPGNESVSTMSPKELPLKRRKLDHPNIQQMPSTEASPPLHNTKRDSFDINKLNTSQTIIPPASPSNGSFDLFSSGASLSSLAGISSLDSLKSLASIPSVLDTSSRKSIDSHRDLEATVTSTNLGSTDDTSSTMSDNGRLVTNLQPLNGVEDANGMGEVDNMVDHNNMTTVEGSPDDGSDKVSNNALVSTSPSRQMAINPLTIPTGQNFVDITEYLNMPQSEAAKKLNIPASTLSKRWKEAVRTRKWPWRIVCKLDKEIMTLLHNVPQGAPIPKEIEARLGYLMRKRQEELKPVVIRL